MEGWTSSAVSWGWAILRVCRCYKGLAVYFSSVWHSEVGCLDCGHVPLNTSLYLFTQICGKRPFEHRGSSLTSLCTAKGLLTLAVLSDISVFPLTLDPSNSSVAIPLSEVKPLPKSLGLSILRNRKELLDGRCNLCILLPVCLVAHPTRHKWRSVVDTQLPWWCSMVSDCTCNATRLNSKVFFFYLHFLLALEEKTWGKDFVKFLILFLLS